MEKSFLAPLKKAILRNNEELLESEVAAMENLYGDIVYAEVLKQFTGKTISPAKARRYWLEALDLRRNLEISAQYRLSIRAALLEVLQSSFREFKNPVFVEAKYLESIRQCSVTDGLTGLYNQTYFKTMLGQNIPLRRRIDDSASALILMDLDNFKLYNDCCGHLAGDEALRVVADIIRDQIRDNDVAARYGGDEFAVYLPKVTKSTAFAVANRIRQSIETTEFRGQELMNGKRLTVSSGISFFSDKINDVNLLIDLADKELYNAKRRRNSISPSNYERRKHQRFATQTLLECHLKDLADTRTAIVSNFSETGVGMWCNLAVSPEEQLLLRFRKPFWSDELELHGIVRQVCHDSDSELCYMGVELERNIGGEVSCICRPTVASTMVH